MNVSVIGILFSVSCAPHRCLMVDLDNRNGACCRRGLNQREQIKGWWRNAPPGGGSKEQGRKQNTTTTKPTSGWKLNPDQKRCIPLN